MRILVYHRPRISDDFLADTVDTTRLVEL